MCKIKNLETGFLFEMDMEKAIKLEEQNPDIYKIVEKNGKKVSKKNIVKKEKIVHKGIYEQVIDKKRDL